MPESPSARGAADSHPGLPVDSDSLTPKAAHAQPRLLALAAVGGAVGASLRYGVARVLPTAPDGFPTATFVTNVSGAFLLGALLELLARLGPDHGGRRLLRLGLGTGVLGAFTTYSTLAVEVTELGRDGHVPLGLLYGLVSAAAGLLAAAAGIAVAALGHRGGRRALAIEGEPADCTDSP